MNTSDQENKDIFFFNYDASKDSDSEYFEHQNDAREFNIDEMIMSLSIPPNLRKKFIKIIEEYHEKGEAGDSQTTVRSCKSKRNKKSKDVRNNQLPLNRNTVLQQKLHALIGHLTTEQSLDGKHISLVEPPEIVELPVE